MCGIAGILTSAEAGDLRTQVNRMTAALWRRGPDADGVFVDADAGVALGHRRLAILDLSERGAQPMHSACGRYVLSFNGEIYNHLALRQELDAIGGLAWRGTSDTETLLAGFARWGVGRTLERSVGMFALALWDRETRELTLARDRFGEKPLYYGYVDHGKSFVFGSELKALREHAAFDNPIDRSALALFLSYSYVPAPHSIYENVFKLEPGAILSLNLERLARRELRSQRYWSYADVARAGLADPIRGEAEGIGALESAMREAIALQMVADVSVGAFLSGGVDSSMIVALMQAQSTRPVKTFTVGFDEAGFDEAPHAAAVARRLGTDHTEIRVGAGDTLALVPNLPTIYDEPFGDSSQIPTAIVCAVARREVTVALSGDAGDELLAGYNRYVIGPKLWQAIAKCPPILRPALGAAIAATPGRAWDLLASMPGPGRRLAAFSQKAYKVVPSFGSMHGVDDLYRALVVEWPLEEVPVLGASRASSTLDVMADCPGIHDPVERMMFLDGVTYLPDDILTKVDRASMAVSLETRVPLLDHRVAAVAWRLPMEMKIRDGQSKWAMRQILYRYVPPELIERPKAGFTAPIGQWLRGPLREWGAALLAEGRVRDEGFLDPAVVSRLWAEHGKGTRDWSHRLWNLLAFQAWLESQRA